MRDSHGNGVQYEDVKAQLKLSTNEIEVLFPNFNWKKGIDQSESGDGNKSSSRIRGMSTSRDETLFAKFVPSNKRVELGNIKSFNIEDESSRLLDESTPQINALKGGKPYDIHNFYTNNSQMVGYSGPCEQGAFQCEGIKSAECTIKVSGFLKDSDDISIQPPALSHRGNSIQCRDKTPMNDEPDVSEIVTI